MESHVARQPTLGEIRQRLLAVVVGNPLFTPEEQLLANHDAHDSQDIWFLDAWLNKARMLEAERGFKARLRAAQQTSQPAVNLHPDAQAAEVTALVRCRALKPGQKWAVVRLAGDSAYGGTTRLRFLGSAYQVLLANLGWDEEPRRGFEGIFDN